MKGIIKKEEEQFNTTLQRGINKFKQLTKNMKAGDTLSGDNTFLLYGKTCSVVFLCLGTFGFPLDLIQIMCDEKKFVVDTPAFTKILDDDRIAASNVLQL